MYLIMAFRITTNEPCPALDPDDVMTTVPLTDTYDTSLLQFVSATPPQSSIDTTNGVITWINVGPIYPGEKVNVQVTFLGLEPSPEVATPITNTTCVIGANFSDGKPTNDACDTVSAYITPTRSISGTVWSEGAGGTTGWVGATGYEAGTLFHSWRHGRDLPL